MLRRLISYLKGVLRRRSYLMGIRRREKGLCQNWTPFSKLNAPCSQLGSATGMSLQFAKGAFVSTLRNGHWILLHEVNLAPPETLQKIGAVLAGEKGMMCLAERCDVDYIERRPCFRMFACMNPATDAGKRELPYVFRIRVAECFVHDLMDDDLRISVNKYLYGLHTAKGVTTKHCTRRKSPSWTSLRGSSPTGQDQEQGGEEVQEDHKRLESLNIMDVKYQAALLQL